MTTHTNDKWPDEDKDMKREGDTLYTEPFKTDEPAEWYGEATESQFWVAKVDKYGTHWNTDGPHESYEDAEFSILLLKSLNKDDTFAVTETIFRPIETPKQKAERERAVEIQKMYEIAQNLPQPTNPDSDLKAVLRENDENVVTALYDAGYRLKLEGKL